MTDALTHVAETRVQTLAAELHDGVCQELFAAEIDLHELRSTPGMSAAALEIVDRLSARMSAGSRDLRAALQSFTAPGGAPDDRGCATERVAAMVAAFRELHEHELDLRTDGAGPEPDPAGARLLARAVREGLANVAKHAQARHVLVVVRRGRRSWTVEVHDDGHGDAAAIRACVAAARSFGLYSLTGDCARLGGRMRIRTSPSHGGVLLTVAVPVARPAA